MKESSHKSARQLTFGRFVLYFASLVFRLEDIFDLNNSPFCSGADFLRCTV